MDFVVGGAGADAISGGDGNDQLYADNTVTWSNTLIDSGVGITGAGEILSGDAGDDVVIGAASDDALLGGAGKDTLAGREGNDILMGDSGMVFAAPPLSEFDAIIGAARWPMGPYLNYHSPFTSSPALSIQIDKIDNGVGSANRYEVKLSSLANPEAPRDNWITAPTTGDADQLYGGSGDDWLFGEIGNDVLNGGAGSDVLVGGSENDQLRGGAGDDIMLGGTGNDTYFVNVGDGVENIYDNFGNGETNTIVFGAGINPADIRLFQGSLGLDLGNGDVVHIQGVDYNDITNTSSIQNFQFADGTVLTIQQLLARGFDMTGTAGDDTIIGTSVTDRIVAGAGNDVLDGRGGADIMTGGLGNDTYVVDNSGDVVVESSWLATEIDTVQSSISYRLGTNVENLTLTGDAAIDATGNGLNNVLIGNSANNTLNGSTGADSMRGGLGDDSYVVENAGDVIVEGVDEGVDTVISSNLSHTLAANVENLKLIGGVAINGTGNELDNTLDGLSNLAANMLSGGAGNDTYIIGYGDTVIEGTNSGIDTVMTDRGGVLSANLENMTLLGSAGLSGTGNASNNVMTGNSAMNTLIGGAGTDTLIGGAGNDTLDGGTDADVLIGGEGNDMYILDNVGDVVIELRAMDGIDSVQSNFAYTLDANLEHLTLTGTDAINGIGNASDNKIIGNVASNLLDGGVGNDMLSGDAGDDTLLGGAGSDGLLGGAGNDSLNGGTGNDSLNGGSGIDMMVGGDGFDTYYVDDAADTVIENLNEGLDTIATSVSYIMGTNIENIYLSTSNSGSLTGNDLSNNIAGNNGNDTLIGLAGDDTLNGSLGADTMIGGSGNDNYAVDNLSDVVVEDAGAGKDRVNSSISYVLSANVEDLYLSGAASDGTGNELDNYLGGTISANTLIGGAGNDTLDGYRGSDTLLGGTGNDTYNVQDAAALIIEGVNEGIDLVKSSVTYTLTDNVENLTLTQSSTAINATGNALDNILDSRANNWVNVLAGGQGNDTYMFSTGDVIVENQGEGIDTVMSYGSFTLGANLENLTLFGTSVANGTGNTLDNVLIGNGEVNTLSGGAGNDLLNGGQGKDILNGDMGNDILQGGQGNDRLFDTSGNNVFDGGAGMDVLFGNSGNEIFIGGAEYDNITTGDGADIIVFNRGDGMDIINGSIGTDDTISLGKGINYADIALSKVNNDLVLEVGAGEQITLTNWYNTAANYKSVIDLQVMADAMTAFDATSVDPLLNQAVQNFDFTAIVNAFDQARGASTTFMHWSATNSLLTSHLSGSDTTALGGDLAHQYGTVGTLTGMGLTSAQTALNDPMFGGAPQTLRPLQGLQGGGVSL